MFDVDEWLMEIDGMEGFEGSLKEAVRANSVLTEITGWLFDNHDYDADGFWDLLVDSAKPDEAYKHLLIHLQFLLKEKEGKA